MSAGAGDLVNASGGAVSAARSPLAPPFEEATALAKVQAAEKRVEHPGPGNENWEFAPDGLMRRREASINDIAIEPTDRRIFGPRPDGEQGRQIPLQ